MIVEAPEMTAPTTTNADVNAAVKFLTTLFNSGDIIAFRPIEVWEELDGKKSKTDYSGQRWITVDDPISLAASVRAMMIRAETTLANLFFGVCPRYGKEGFDLKHQIRRVNVIWADIDNQSVEQALAQCEEANLPQPSIVVRSGHGVHLYWLLEEPYVIDDAPEPLKIEKEWIEVDGKKKPIKFYLEGDEKVYLDDPKTGRARPEFVPKLSPKAKRLEFIVKGLAAKFGKVTAGNKSGADNTHDLTRLLRLPGTLNRKNQRNGGEITECKLIRCDAERRYSIDEFSHFAELSDDAKREKQLEGVHLPELRKMSTKRRDALNERILECKLAESDRSSKDFALCCFAVERGYSPDDVYALCHNVGKFAERDRSYFDTTWENAARAAKESMLVKITEGKASSSSTSKKKIKTAPPSEKQTGDSKGITRPCTDLGNAERHADRHRNTLRFIHAWKKWLTFNAVRWLLDDAGQVIQLAKETVRGIYQEAAEADSHEDRVELSEWAVTSESSTRINAMITLAQSELPISHHELDTDPMILNVLNGEIDLRTGELKPHNREHYITQLAPVNYDPNAKATLFEETLSTIFAGNEELIEYVWKLLGYSLTGMTTEQILPIFHGVGANGKSTVLNVFMDMLGTDYAMKAPPDLLMARSGEAHPTERADLFRKRFVAAIETDDGRRLAESMVKELTGGDKIRARRMREDFWEFDPTHKIVLCTNHKPAIRGTDHAIWRRIRLIPFSVVIAPEHQDKQLPEKLKAEAEGILAWCVRGCLAWQREGLGTPDCVMQATADYKAAEDVIGQFIDEECTVHQSLKVKASEFISRFKLWAERNGLPELSGKRIGDYLTNIRGFQRQHSNGKRYAGIGLKPLRECDSEDEE